MAKATRPHFIRCGIEYLGASMVVSSLPAVPSAEVPVPPATAAVSAAAPIASPTIVSRNSGLGSPRWVLGADQRLLMSQGAR